jgi:DNA-binding transcriptional ArsR family regulator
MTDVIQVYADVYKALGHPLRLKMALALLDGEMSATKLGEISGLAQSPASQHLATMRRLGAVLTRRESQRIYYRLSVPAVEVIR